MITEYYVIKVRDWDSRLPIIHKNHKIQTNQNNHRDIYKKKEGKEKRDNKMDARRRLVSKDNAKKPFVTIIIAHTHYNIKRCNSVYTLRESGIIFRTEKIWRVNQIVNYSKWIKITSPIWRPILAPHTGSVQIQDNSLLPMHFCPDRSLELI